MTSPTDRIAAVLREADFYAKRPDHYYAILAEQVAAELQLTEERWHPESPAGRCRWVTPWVSAWSAAEGKP